MTETAQKEAAKAIPPIPLKFAPGWKRLISYLIDWFLINILVILIIFIAYYKFYMTLMPLYFQNFDSALKMGIDFDNAHRLIIVIASFVIQAAYFSLSWKARGQTIGAWIMKIAVITITKKKLTILQGVWRFSVIFLFTQWPILGIPLIFTINPVYFQKLHDAISNTVVVELPEVDEDRKKREWPSEPPSTPADQNNP